MIGSEALSCITDWSDRSTCILFGDGAGAVVLTAEAGEKTGICLWCRWQDGRCIDTIQRVFFKSVWHAGADAEAAVDDSGKNACVRMDGQAIFRFAVRKVPQLIEELLQKNSLQKEDIKYYILHQANERIVEAVAKKNRTTDRKFPMNVQEYGNTSSASVPILLDELCRDGRVKSRRQAGDRRIRRRADLGSQCCDMAVGRWKRRNKMQTEINNLLEIEYPIIQGGMAWVAEHHLAAAVSEAGGFGLIGAANAPADWVERADPENKGINGSTVWRKCHVNESLCGRSCPVIAEEGVKAVTTGAGNPEKIYGTVERTEYQSDSGCGIGCTGKNVWSAAGQTRLWQRDANPADISEKVRQ